ncbi:MAG: tRNA lysidine(34) synthetase TilS, partial [Desulfobacca sp.]|uniref:tRNA lysidine(34) synthetase TilS n=1 Tax=Desulfobacca sp. TaxID=2067990 RepID=UPI00404AE1B0
MPPLAVMLPRQVAAYIRCHRLIHPQERLLVAVSGGPDSTALLHLLHRLAPRWPFSLAVAHFDHGLRGEASRADAVWVEELAHSLGLPCHLGAGDVRAQQQERRVSCQVAARELRHRFLRDIQEEYGYEKIALGHTADDQLELFFLRLLRGTGPEGLKGMRPGERGLIRPLLATDKAAILAWLADARLPFRQDASNLDRRYRRNQIRLDLIPRLLAYNPRLAAAVARLQGLWQEQEDYLAQETQRARGAVQLSGETAGFRLSRAGLLVLHPALQKRLLLHACTTAGVDRARLTQRHLTALLHLAQRPQTGGAISLPGGWQVRRVGDELQWLPADQTAPPEPPLATEVLLTPPEVGTCSFLHWTFTWETFSRPDGASAVSSAPTT